jgi:hypothetical protein
VSDVDSTALRKSLDATPSGTAERWSLSPSATAFVRDRAHRLGTDPATILEDLVLVERRRVEGSI